MVALERLMIYEKNPMPAGDRIYQKALKEALKETPDNELVTELLNKAFRLGSPDAAYALGSWHFQGRVL